MIKKVFLSLFCSVSLFASTPHHARAVGKNAVQYDNGIVKKGGHRNWRNNNPGNLLYGKFAREHGAIGTDGKFAIFATMEDGFRAQKALLKKPEYINKTIARALHRYAPPFENNTWAYIRYVTKHLGVSHRTKIKNLSERQLDKMVRIMAKYEGMRVGRLYVDDAKYALAYNDGPSFGNEDLASFPFAHLKNKDLSKVKKAKKTDRQRKTELAFASILNPPKNEITSILMSSN